MNIYFFILYLIIFLLLFEFYIYLDKIALNFNNDHNWTSSYDIRKK